MYKAYSFVLTSDMLEPHSDPEVTKLQIVNYNGLRVVVDKTYQPMQLCILFTEGTKIADWFLREKKLYQKDPDTGEKWPGFFEPLGVVKTIKLRGEYSHGFIYIPTWEEIKAWGIVPDTTFDTISIDGVNKVLCSKYIRESDIRVSKNQQKQGQQKKKKENFSEYLVKHFDTPQVFEAIKTIPVGATLIFTIKMHGTSGITGYLPVNNVERSWRTLWRNRTKTEYMHQTQSRNVHLYSERDGILAHKQQDNWYKSDFRLDIHNAIKTKLRKGETVYYEIVGYDGQKTIMPSYGDIRFTYRCKPGENQVYVYRITQLVGEEILELSWDALVKRCRQLGLQHVAEIERKVYDGNAKKLIEFLKKCDEQLGACDPFDSSHPCEGVVIRIEHHRMSNINLMKYKFDKFCELENIRLYSDKSEPDVEQMESL